MIGKLFKAGADVFRINMSHTSQDRMRELVAMIRGVERDTGRPIGILVDLQGPKLRLGTFAGGSAMVESGASFVLDSDPAPGDATRAYLPHPEIFAAVAPGPHAADRRRQGAAHRHASRAQAHDHARRSGRQIVRPQGRQPAGFDHSVLGFGREGPLGSRSRAQCRHRLGGAVVHPAAGRHRRGQENHARPRRGDGQDREAASGHPAVGNHGSRRRADGGARRSRRRDAAGESARRAEADDAHGPRHRQAGGGRDADAGIDDLLAGADARGSFRRRHGDLRRRRRGHAVGGIGGRANIRWKRSPP